MSRCVQFFCQGQGRVPGKQSAPKHGDLRETKGKQEKALALSVRQGGYFCPQCGQLRGSEMGSKAERSSRLCGRIPRNPTAKTKKQGSHPGKEPILSKKEKFALYLLPEKKAILERRYREDGSHSSLRN